MTLAAEEKEGDSRPEGEAPAAGRTVVQEGNRLQPHPRVQPICADFCGQLVQDARANSAQQLRSPQWQPFHGPSPLPTSASLPNPTLFGIVEYTPSAPWP